jgi:exopolysaccharide biosynthesis predicted pyruvyltransferase EpsI
MEQPKTISLHCSNIPAIKKRHQCIAAIRERQMNLIGHLFRAANDTRGRKALLVNPAYHANVGDHMITLGEIEFLRRVGIKVPEDFEQSEQKWQNLLPNCEKTNWWEDDTYNAYGVPSLLHGGDNWGDLWRRNQEAL